jgi:hypothetical protein
MEELANNIIHRDRKTHVVVVGILAPGRDKDKMAPQLHSLSFSIKTF